VASFSPRNWKRRRGADWPFDPGGGAKGHTVARAGERYFYSVRLEVIPLLFVLLSEKSARAVFQSSAFAMASDRPHHFDEDEEGLASRCKPPRISQSLADVLIVWRW
jgi:hypothetical protein